VDREPDWVSAKPKRFAWSLGLGMASARTVITDSGIRGYPPRTICLICLPIMRLESALGFCLGRVVGRALLREVLDRQKRRSSRWSCLSTAATPPGAIASSIDPPSSSALIGCRSSARGDESTRRS
jgi:Domain of unknown function (DUF4395)